MATKEQCSAQVWPTIWRAARCSRTASVERDGKHYCKQHDPVAVAAKKKARDAAWAAEWAEKSRVERLNDAAPDLLAALERLVDRVSAEGIDAARAAIAKATQGDE